ncbi:unnamed protein product [Ilex paraguariensis]|uniref:Protein kinase domain-containing protein n=1 Tax=Ilex paraguariensis TaxID=185542 RepID=A0ABC8QWQ6_9AQUA
MEILTAEQAGLTGAIPKEIGNLRNLGVLEMDLNSLRGHGLPNLEQLCLGSNTLTGVIPDSISNASKLTKLDLISNRFSGPIPNSLGSLKLLEILNLGRNNLTCASSSSESELRFITSLTNCRFLRVLWVVDNPLNGTISVSIGNFSTSLQNFAASNCTIKGDIPAEIGIGSLKVAIVIDLSSNQFSGDIPSTVGGLQNVIKLFLDDNRLQGSIPESFSGLISLEFLDLSQNNLSGVIPKSLEALQRLTYFNVSFNRLRGEIPNGGPFMNFTKGSFMSNEAFCGAPWLQFPPCDSNSHHRSKNRRVLLIVFASLGIASLVLALTIVLLLIRGRRRNHTPAQNDLLPKIVHERISYHELRRATDGFSESNLIGTGSSGSVYKGILADGTSFAIKVFNMQMEGAFKSFDNECDVLRNLRPRNLTKVISSCSNLDFKALVLDYMPNGSLEKWLYSHNYYLDITQRLDIMIDVACALEYLHHGYSTPVVHCDLKPSNVLLDVDMVGHLTDFGIAKLFSAAESLVQTTTLGTVGYIPPGDAFG